MTPPRIRKLFSGFTPDLQIDLKGPCTPFRDLCPGVYVQGRGSLCRGSMLRGGGHCPWGLYLGGSLSRGFLSGGLCPGEGISVQGVYAEGRGSLTRGSLSGGFCPGGSLSGCPCPQGLHLGGFCAGGLCLGVTVQGVSI